MEASARSRTDRFTTAFRDIEHQIRKIQQPDRFVPLSVLAREYADTYHLTSEQQVALATFITLRNAISHGRFHEGQPIAVPVEAAVKDIERLRDQITSKCPVLSILEPRNVCTTSPDEPISTVLDHVRRFDYSQIPVYGKDGYAGLLTTNAIARWLAIQLKLNGGLAETGTVRHVLAFAESHERVALAGDTITAAEAIYHLTHSEPGQAPAPAVLITSNGKPAGKPLRVITSWDLPELYAALGFQVA